MDRQAIRLECLRLAASMARVGTVESVTRTADDLFDWVTALSVEAEAAKANAKKAAAK